MREYLIDIAAAPLFVGAGLAAAWRYERRYRRAEAAHQASLADDTMAIAEAVEVQPASAVAEGLIRDALATAEYLDSKALWLELDTYTPEGR